MLNFHLFETFKRRSACHFLHQYNFSTKNHKFCNDILTKPAIITTSREQQLVSFKITALQQGNVYRTVTTLK
jgi:hypothetical protein